MEHKENESDTIILNNYGSITAIFKVDENESVNKYNISEW
jgi:hypothetical protein